MWTRPLRAAACAAAAAALTCGVAHAADPRDNQRPVFGSTWSGPFTDPLDAQADALAATLEGQYVGTWPGAFAKRPDVDEVPAWVVWKRIDLPAFGSRVMWHEVREGGPTGRVLRMRIVVISDDDERSHNYLTLYPLLDFDAYSRADLNPEKLAKLNRGNVAFFGRGCQLNAIGDKGGFVLTAERSSCVIVYPDGKARYNQFQITAGADGFAFFEAAYDLDGKFLAGARQPSRFTRSR